jgi:hypothetical protein
LREWIKIPLPRSVTISAYHWYDELVQVTYHDEQMVLGRNWPVVIYKYDLEHVDVLEFKIKAFDLKMNIYKLTYA